MTHWREPFFVLVLILGLYGLYLSQPIYSVPPAIAYGCGVLYALFAVFRFKKEFDSLNRDVVLRLLARFAAAAVLFTVETVTTL